jgi:hypothetical protein
MTPRLGFRIVGACDKPRRLVVADLAFEAYAACDERAEVESEAYLSAFDYGADFADRLNATGSVKGFDGEVGARWVWFDIDRTDLNAALLDARRLALGLTERYAIGDDALLIFFSGSKGFHVGLPSSLWAGEPGVAFNRYCRRLAESVAGVGLDVGVYDKVRAFRAPNSRHPKTGLHKRRLSFDELQGLSLDAIRRLAEKPEPFEIPADPAPCPQAVADWRDAMNLTPTHREAFARSPDDATLNRNTEEFIRGNVAVGDRHRLLFSAAANLGEFGCPDALAVALLSPVAIDLGLTPGDVRRGIANGLQRGRRCA